MDINAILNNQENIYYGHGTGIDSQEITDSIIRNGLRCSHGSLYYTSEVLGIGTKIEDSEKEMLKKWPHKDSNIIIVISLPIKYKIIDSASIGTYNMADAAFYYTPNENTRKSEKLTNSPYVMPQFIVGYYNARDDSFTPNYGYYENLTKKDQEQLFQQVKQNYFNIIEEGCGIEKYQEMLTNLGYVFPLTNEEVITLKKNKATQKLFSKLGSELLNKQMILPNGKKITFDKYVKEIVLPFIPTEGLIVLNNGNKLPVYHFIMECVLYDCQERYNGDFSKYIKENINIEETKQINCINETENHKKI